MNMEDPETNFLAIPHEVMYSSIFPYLKLNELLRLRRICKRLRLYSDDYLRNWDHFTDQEREIGQNENTFADFIRRDLPTSHIFLNNTSPAFFEDPHVPEFLHLYSSRITHLRVKYFFTCLSHGEYNFYSALSNLKSFEIEVIDTRTRKCAMNGHRLFRRTSYFPVTFRSLQTLGLNEILCSESLDQEYAWDFIRFCDKLEHLKHPRFKTERGHWFDEEDPFEGVANSISKRRSNYAKLNKMNNNNEPKSQLRSYDLQHHDEPGNNCIDYIHLLDLCNQEGVKLLNVDAPLNDIFQCDIVRREFDPLADPVVSLDSLASVKNVSGGLVLTELRNLEQVIIKSTADSSFGKYWTDNQKPQWPKLAVLEIIIDSVEMSGSTHFETRPTEELLDFLFYSVERDKLKELRIGHGRGAGKSESGKLPRIQMAPLIRNCGNVTRLSLSQWHGESEDLWHVWRGLEKLEEVELDQCENVGDDAFLGQDATDPKFLNLKDLKKFKLSGLDRMIRISDRSFSKVFRHLSIKKFCISSKEPIKSVTVSGIRSLLTGKFNNSVEKFSFQGWSLQNVSEEQLSELSFLFRSSHML